MLILSLTPSASRTVFAVASSLLLVATLGACQNKISLDQPGSELTIRTSPNGPGQGEPDDVGTPDPDVVITNPGEPDVGGEPEAVTEPEPVEPTMKESTKADLVWKRYRAVEQDLMRGLNLQKDQVCNELGRFACVDKVHLAPLGGNEPFEQSQYEPVSEPTATTAIAFERTVLAACSKRVDLDRQSGPFLFKSIDLDAPSLNPDDVATAGLMNADLTQLYRNLLSRNPETEELDALRELARDDGQGAMNAADFAKAACLAVGSSVEALFY